MIATSTGRSLVAARELAAGTIVQRFDGPIVAWADVPEDEVRHVLWVDENQWMIPTTDARYIDHGCDPNCDVEDFAVFTTRLVREGDKLAFDYARTDSLDGPDAFWDPRWTFHCACGARSCRGVIDRYVIR